MLTRQLATHLPAISAVGQGPLPDQAQLAHVYRQADLRSQDDVDKIVSDAEAIVHVQPLAKVEGGEALGLELASLGTFRLLHAAREKGIRRVILLSSLAMFDAYNKKYIIDEMWKPLPDTHAQALAPYYAELVAREFARQGPPWIFCLRIEPHNPHPEDLKTAVQAALQAEIDPLGYRWKVLHISRSARFNTRNARLELNWQPRPEGA
jgi:hypothetical protein